MELRFRPAALANLEDIYDYIAADNPSNAGEFVELLEETCAVLADQPRIGRERPEIRPGLRSFPVARYVIFYCILDEVIEIVNIIHGARDINTFFEEP